MAQNYPLDPVIRKVSPGTKPASRAQKIVAINCNTKKVVPTGSFWRDMLRRTPGSEFNYYLVSNTSEGRNVAECKMQIFHVRDFDTEYSVGFNITYRASCDADQEEKVAQALFTDPQLSESHPHRFWSD